MKDINHIIIWVDMKNDIHRIMYSDISQVKRMGRGKGIELKLKYSFKKIYLLNTIEDIDNIYYLLQKEVDKWTD